MARAGRRSRHRVGAGGPLDLPAMSGERDDAGRIASLPRRQVPYDLTEQFRREADHDERPSRRHASRSEEHTSELQSPDHLVCRLLLEKKKKRRTYKESNI